MDLPAGSARRRGAQRLADPGLRRLLLVIGLTALPFGTLEFLLPLYARALGGSPSFIGLLVGTGAAAGLAVRPLVGWLADRGHVPALLRLGAGGVALGLVIWSLASGPAVLLAGRVAVSLGLACLGIAAQMLVSALAPPEERGGQFGRLAGASAVGHIAGAILAGLVLLLADAETQGEIKRLLANLSLPLGLPAPLERVAALHLVFSGYAAAAGLALLAAARRWHYAAAAAPPTRIWRIWRELFGEPAVRQLLAVGVMISVAYSLSVPMILPLLEDRFGAGLAGLAIAYAIPGLLYAVAPGILGRKADQRGHRWAVGSGLLVSASVYALLPLLPELAWTALVWSFEALAYSLYVPALQALIAKAAPPERRGAAFSLYSLIAALGAMLAAPIGGLLYQHVARGAPFFLSAFTLVSAGLMMHRQRRE